jgi:beta-N-acetylhexosaminidase
MGLAGALLAGVLSCSRVTPEAAPAPATETPAPNVRLIPRLTLDTAAWVDSVFASLSPRERVAQMVTFWVLGDYTAADDSALAASVLAARAGAGGFTMSLGTPIEAASKINYLQRHAKVPLFVSSDLEPSLMRLEAGVFPHYMIETGGATSFPTAMAIAATGRDEDAFSVARAIAQEARAVGIHINFAPTADVNINPNNPVIATRSFGEDPQQVARLTAQFVRGTRDGGLLATAKHFPGHGDTDVDSHVGLPVVTASSDRLSSVELVPFRAAINAGAELVMSAHIALPALGGDSTTPATLREDVMTGLLRDSLGFKGIAITDALTMQGIGKGYTIEESVVQAVRAGTDILLRPGDDVNLAIDAVMGGIERGKITQARIDGSVKRILLHKARAGLANGRYVDIDSLRLVVATKPHLELAQDVAQRAITLVRDTASAVPIRTQRVMVVQYMPETELKAGRAFNREMNRLRPGTRMVGKLSPTTGQAYLDSVAARLDRADAIVLATFVRRVEGEGRTTVPPHISAWIDSVATSPKAVVVSFGNPYLIRQFPRSQAYMNTYGVGDALEVAAARALFGAAPISGKSPVSLPGYFKLGDGLTR